MNYFSEDFKDQIPDNKFIFIYAKSFSKNSFSGQATASQIVIDALCEEGWKIDTLIAPAFRNEVQVGILSKFIAFKNLVKFLFFLLIYIVGSIRNGFSQTPLCVNLGQTKYALLRDGISLLIRSIITPSRSINRAIISLHGSLFMNWEVNCLEFKIFKMEASCAKFITVLGPKQKEKLLSLGIEDSKILILHNTCKIPPISINGLQQKIEQISLSKSKTEFNILYLSSLIKSKGYLEYLNSILELSKNPSINYKVNAVLCGSIFEERNKTLKDKSYSRPDEEINIIINDINRSGHVSCRWVNGADGEVKEKLFYSAHIFVLPSRYPVEAQPISIIEALASGCTVVTTRAGEIPNTVNSNSSLLLDLNYEYHDITKSLMTYFDNIENLKSSCTNAVHLFHSRYSLHVHLAKWKKILPSIIN